MSVSSALRFLLFATPAALFATGLFAQSTSESIHGRIDGGHYIAPSGLFKVRIPVRAELGGTITDTANVVTFQDDFTLHQSIACFQMDATQRWENETRGRKDYLAWFFSNWIQVDFQQRYPGSKIESAHFMPNLEGGCILVTNSLPGGSMFASRILSFGNLPPPVAKRGNLLFVRDEHVYVLSIELAEKVLQRTTYDKTPEEENKILRQRLLSLLGQIAFIAPASKTSPTAKIAPAAPASP